MPDNSVVTHPQRERIDAMILGGLSLRKIAEAVTPAVSYKAVHRYKNAAKHPKTTVTVAQETVTSVTPNAKSNVITGLDCDGEASQTGKIPLSSRSDAPTSPTRTPLLERAEKLAARIEKAMDVGESAVRVVFNDDNKSLEAVGADLRVLPPLFREANNSLRLLGELTGELNHASSQTSSITINIVQHSESAAPVSRPFDLEVSGEIGPE